MLIREFETKDYVVFPSFIRTVINEKTVNLANDIQKISPEKLRGDIWNNTTCSIQELKNLFLTEGKKIVDDYYDKTKTQMQLGRAWLNITRQDKTIPPHHHGNAIFVGTFYLETHDDGGLLTILDPRGCVPLPNFYSIENIEENPCFVSIKPQKGGLIFFPNYLLHYVNTNISNENRYSISANYSVVMKDYGKHNYL